MPFLFRGGGWSLNHFLATLGKDVVRSFCQKPLSACKHKALQKARFSENPPLILLTSFLGRALESSKQASKRMPFLFRGGGWSSPLIEKASPSHPDKFPQISQYILKNTNRHDIIIIMFKVSLKISITTLTKWRCFAS